MPTCWDGRIDSPDHKSHMAYTLDGQVNGECPASHNRRLPQVQVFIRIPNYRGVEFEYVLSDGNRIPNLSKWLQGKIAIHQSIHDDNEMIFTTKDMELLERIFPHSSGNSPLGLLLETLHGDFTFLRT